MKTPSDAIDHIIRAVNVAGVTGTIDGKIYRLKRPVDSALRDIVVLDVAQPVGDDPVIQDGTFMINCFSKNNSDGQPDETHLDATGKAIETALNNYSHPTEYIKFEIVNMSILPDEDTAQTSYLSIRTRVILEA